MSNAESRGPIDGATPRTAVITVIATALLAIWITLGDLQRLNHADSLIPAFVSLYRWTWFYWGQNRYGMLIPLLAMPFRHPLVNLLFQNGLVTFCGLLLFPLTHACLLGWRTAPLSGALGALIFLRWAPDSFHQDFLLVNQPYAVSTCLGVLGLMAINSKSTSRYLAAIRLASSTVLFFLAFWVSLGALFLILPLFILQSPAAPAANGKRLLKRFPGLLTILGAALANWAVVVTSPYHEDYGWTPLYSWPANAAALLRNIYRITPPAFLIALLALASAGALGCLLSRDPQHRRRVLRASAITFLAALAYFITVAANQHVRQSGFPHRYAMPCIVLFLICLAMLATLAIHRLPPRWRAPLPILLCLGAFAAATSRYGTPSYARVRTTVDQKFGAATRDLLDAQCTHLLGDYWDVWGSVFHANLVLYESRSEKMIWAITDRSQVTRDRWFPLLKVKSARIAVIRSENSERHWPNIAKDFQLPPLKRVSETDQIQIYAPQ